MTQSDKRQKSLEDALEQNAEYYGFHFRDEIVVNEEVFHITYREFLDEPTRRKVNEAYTQYNACDREMLEFPQKDGTIGTVAGVFKEPRVLAGKPFDLDEQISRALWGDEKYERWIAAGGPPGLVQIVWNRMRHQFTKRVSGDSKSS